MTAAYRSGSPSGTIFSAWRCFEVPFGGCDLPIDQKYSVRKLPGGRHALIA
jgi:hypothetical protein